MENVKNVTWIELSTNYDPIMATSVLVDDFISKTKRTIFRYRCNRKIRQLNNGEKSEPVSDTVDDICDGIKDSVKDAVKKVKNEVRVIFNDFNTTGNFVGDDKTVEFDHEMLHLNIGDAIVALPDINEKEVRLTILTLLYLADIIDFETLMGHIDAEDAKNELAIVNSIHKFYTGLVLVPTADTMMINEVFTKMQNLQRIVAFEAGYDGVFGNRNMATLINKTGKFITEFNRTVLKAHGVEAPDPETPVFFSNTVLDSINESSRSLTKQQAAQVVANLGGILQNHTYDLMKDSNGLINLIILTDGRYDRYVIDPGLIAGNGYSFIYIYNDSLCLINAKHTDILSKLINDRNYKLSQKEFAEINADMFTNQRNYTMFDMSKGMEFLSKISNEEFNKLGKKLTFIMNLPWSQSNGADGRVPQGRMRFKSFKSIDDFVLVSDYKCKSPVPGFTMTNIVEGLSVTVKNDDVFVKLVREDGTALVNLKYTIKSYNVM